MGEPLPSEVIGGIIVAIFLAGLIAAVWIAWNVNQSEARSRRADDADDACDG